MWFIFYINKVLFKKLKLVNFDYCGSPLVSCSSYFNAVNRINLNGMKVLDSWQLKPQVGYNKFLINQTTTSVASSSYPPGTLVWLRILSGSIYVNNDTNIGDYVFSGNATRFNLTNPSSLKWNLGVRVLTTRFYYNLPSVQFSFRMNQSGLFSLLATIFDTNFNIPFVNNSYLINGNGYQAKDSYFKLY
jgi:hypothetical protein